MKKSIAIVFIATVLLPTLAYAHHTWIEAGGQQFAVRYGHNGKAEPFAPSKVHALSAYDQTGNTLPVAHGGANSATASAIFKGKPAMVTALLDNGYWSRTGQDAPWKNVPKNALAGATDESHHSVKTSKLVLSWSSAVVQPTGQILELVPLATQPPTPHGLFNVQVLWQGKPLAGAKVAIGKDEKIICVY